MTEEESEIQATEQLLESIMKVFNFETGRAYRCRPEIAEFNPQNYAVVHDEGVGRFAVHRVGLKLEESVKAREQAAVQQAVLRR